MDKEMIYTALEKGLNCSQTVLNYFHERYDLQEEQALKIAQAFESGHFQGGVCGAVTGAYMVLGLAFGSPGLEGREKLKGKVQYFNDAFIEKMGSTQCEKILGINISSEENFKKAIDEKIIEEICPKAVMASIEILEKMI